MTKEPKRLIESESGPLAQSLAASRLRLPSEARLAALAARLASAGVVLAEPARPPPALRDLTRPQSALPTKPLDLSLKAVLAALALGGAAILGALLIRYGTPRAPVTATPATLSTASAESPALAPAAAQSVRVALPQRALAKAPDALSPELAPVRELAAAEIAAAPSEPEANVEPAGTPAPAPAGAPTHPSSSARARTVEPEPKRAAQSSLVARAGDAAASSSERSPLPANTVVDSEVETLKKARSALSYDPVQAFALTERCRAQFPSGAFAQERDFIAISALIRMGRQDEARGRASLFRTHYRNSAYLPQLTRMLGEE